MKIFSKHRKKIDPYRRYGSREFKEKLSVAKNYKRNFSLNSTKSFSTFFAKTGFSSLGLVVGIGIVGGIFYLLVFSPYFLVTEIAVAGNSQIATSDIQSYIYNLEKKRFLLVPQNSFLVLSEGRLNKMFAKDLPEIAEVKTRRNWPNKISLEIVERQPALVLAVGESNFLIDDQGFVMKEVDDTFPQLRVVDQIQEEIKTGENISGKLIPFIVSAQKQWPTKLNIPLVSAKIPGKGASEVEFVSAEGWSVFLSTDRPVANQLNNLVILLNKQISSSDRSRRLAYIDLRLAKWAYYCFRSTPCQQTEQSQETATAGTETSNVPKPE